MDDWQAFQDAMDDVAETGAVDATFTARVAGLLSGQLSGGLDWRDSLRDGIAGKIQVVALNLTDLLEWSGQSDFSRLLPQPTPMSTRVTGDLEQSSSGSADITVSNRD